MAAVVHHVDDVLYCSFCNEDITGYSFESMAQSVVRGSFFIQVQSSLPGPCGQLLSSHVLLVESYFCD